MDIEGAICEAKASCLVCLRHGREILATVGNKHLGQALAVAKRVQDLTLPPKVHSNSQELGSQKRGRQSYGPDYVPKIPVKSVKEGPTLRLVEQTS